MVVIKATDTNYEEILLCAEDKVTIVQFIDAKNSDKQVLTSAFDAISECLSGAIFVSVVREECGLIFHRENINPNSLPTYILYKDTKEVGRLMNVSIKDVITSIKSVVAKGPEKEEQAVTDIEGFREAKVPDTGKKKNRQKGATAEKVTLVTSKPRKIWSSGKPVPPSQVFLQIPPTPINQDAEGSGYGLIEKKFGLQYDRKQQVDENETDYVVIICDTNILSDVDCQNTVRKLYHRAKKENLNLKFVFPFVTLHELQLKKDYLLRDETYEEKSARKSFSNVGGRFLRECLKNSDFYLESKATSKTDVATPDESLIHTATYIVDLIGKPTVVLLTYDRILQILSATYQIFSYESASLDVILRRNDIPLKEAILTNPVFICEYHPADPLHAYTLTMKQGLYYIKRTILKLKKAVMTFWNLKGFLFSDPVLNLEKEVHEASFMAKVKNLQLIHVRILKQAIKRDAKVPESDKKAVLKQHVEFWKEIYDNIEKILIGESNRKELINICVEILINIESSIEESFLKIDSEMRTYKEVKDVSYKDLFGSH